MQGGSRASYVAQWSTEQEQEQEGLCRMCTLCETDVETVCVLQSLPAGLSRETALPLPSRAVPVVNRVAAPGVWLCLELLGKGSHGPGAQGPSAHMDTACALTPLL